MEKIDARRLSPETQYELRKQYVRFRKKGISNMLAAETVGLSVTRASTIWQLYQHGGLSAIKPKPRGRRQGEHRQLNASQEAELQVLLVDKTPEQLKLAFALWTRDAVRLVIRKKYGMILPLRTISDYLKRWGFTPQRPTKRAYEQNPKAVEQWHETTYPQILAKAKKEKDEIHWGDETGIQNDA